MRWVFEICLFEPNGELQFRKPVFSILRFSISTDGT